MENPLRSFIALEPDETIRQLITTYTAPLMAKFKHGFRWVRTENMHLTMKFMAQLDPSTVKPLQEVLNSIAQDTPPFTLQLTGTGVFPSWKNPRTVWIGLQNNADLGRLSGEIEERLSQFGILQERKPFSAHLTLCRIGDYTEFETLHQLEDFLRDHPMIPTAWQINEMVLFKSVLQREGPIYTILSRHAFKANEKV